MDTFTFITELDMFVLAASVSVAFNDPGHVNDLLPGHGEIALEDLHPMLRGGLGRG